MFRVSPTSHGFKPVPLEIAIAWVFPPLLGRKRASGHQASGASADVHVVDHDFLTFLGGKMTYNVDHVVITYDYNHIILSHDGIKNPMNPMV